MVVHPFAIDVGSLAVVMTQWTRVMPALSFSSVLWSECDHWLNSFHSNVQFGPLWLAVRALSSQRGPLPFDVFDSRRYRSTVDMLHLCPILARTVQTLCRSKKVTTSRLRSTQIPIWSIISYSVWSGQFEGWSWDIHRIDAWRASLLWSSTWQSFTIRRPKPTGNCWNYLFGVQGKSASSRVSAD